MTHFVLVKIDFEFFNFSDESEDSEHFLKNSIFEKCFDPFCMGKIDFEIFNFLDESEDSEHFSKNNGKNYAIVMEKIL